MPSPQPALILNRVLILLNRSFAMYLSNAMPYFSQTDDELRQEFESLVTDQKHYVRKLGEEILAMNSRVEAGDFPMLYTDCHDLSAHYLLKELTRDQKLIVQATATAITNLVPTGNVAWNSLLEEVQGNARGHLDTLQNLLARDTKPKLSTIG